MTNVVNLSLGIYTSTNDINTIRADVAQAPNLTKLFLIGNKYSLANLTNLLTSTYNYTAEVGTDKSCFSITAQQLSTSTFKKILLKNKPLKCLIIIRLLII